MLGVVDLDTVSDADIRTGPLSSKSLLLQVPDLAERAKPLMGKVCPIQFPKFSERIGMAMLLTHRDWGRIPCSHKRDAAGRHHPWRALGQAGLPGCPVYFAVGGAMRLVTPK